MQNPKSISSLDRIRALYPELGVAVYGYTPGGALTLELLTGDGKTFTFTAETLDQAVALAFPEFTEPDPPAAAPTPPTDIFD